MAQNIDELQRRLDTLMGKDLEVDVVDEPFRDKEMDYFETGLDYQFLLPELEKQRKSAINIQRYSRGRNAMNKYTKKKKAAKRIQRAYRKKKGGGKHKSSRMYRKRSKMYGKMYGGTNSSELSDQQKQYDEFLSGIIEPYNPYPDATRSMTALEGTETPLENIEDPALLDKIQSLVGPARREKKLKELKILTELLIQNFKSNVRNLNDTSMPSVLIYNYYEQILFKNTQNKHINKPIHDNDYTLTTLESMFNLPEVAARSLLQAIIVIEDDIDPYYSIVTLPKLSKYLTIDDNLDNFIVSFSLILRLRGEYSEIDIQTYINNFLEKIQP